MPLPLAMMIPFMGIQSAVMAKQFGENFQYGKRRISALDNDTFNKLTPKLMLSNANKELADMIPEMKESITSMHEFQEFLVREFLIMIDNIIKAGLGELLGLSQSSLDKIENSIEHFLHGHIHFADPNAPSTPSPTKTPVNPNIPLLNATAAQIRGWSDIKLFRIFNNELHLYDNPSKARITTFYNVRVKKTKPTPAPPIDPNKLKPIGTRPIFRSTNVNRILVRTINTYLTDGRYTDAFLLLAKLRANAVKAIALNRSPTSLRLNKAIKIDVEAFIIKVNVWLGIDKGLN